MIFYAYWVIIQLVIHSSTAHDICKNANANANWKYFNLTDRCYLLAVTTQRKTWEKARDACKNKANGADLASIHGREVQQFIEKNAGH